MHGRMVTKDNCDTQRLLFSKDCFYRISWQDEYYSYWHTYPTDEEILRGKPREGGEQKNILVMF